jgi:hypothetical protein
MDRDDEAYYNSYFDLFRTDGWKQLTEELTQNAATINNVTVVKDSQDLNFRQGQLEVLLYLLKFEDSINNSYDDLAGTDD